MQTNQQVCEYIIVLFSGSAVSFSMQIRLLFFFTMRTLENEKDQKKGVVTVYYGIDQGNTFKKDLPFQFATARDSLPMKGAANHFAYNNPYLTQLMVLVEVAMSAIEQSRFRSHFGKEKGPNDIESLALSGKQATCTDQQVRFFSWCSIFVCNNGYPP
jgi:hypothetical protein